MFFAYTPPLPLAAIEPLHAYPVPLMAFCAVFCTLAAFAAAFTPKRVPTPALPAGPVYDPRCKRWRDPVTNRFVKSPR